MNGQNYLQSKGGTAFISAGHQPLPAVSAPVAELTPDLIIENITQCDEHGRFVAKCIAGDMFELELMVPTAEG